MSNVCIDVDVLRDFRFGRIMSPVFTEPSLLSGFLGYPSGVTLTEDVVDGNGNVIFVRFGFGVIFLFWFNERFYAVVLGLPMCI